MFSHRLNLIDTCVATKEGNTAHKYMREVVNNIHYIYDMLGNVTKLGRRNAQTVAYISALIDISTVRVPCDT